MQTLTLTQPWATLVVTGAKRVETRGWTTRYRGPLAIHAGKGWSTEDRAFAAYLRTLGLLDVDPLELPRGAVLGEVVLLDVRPTEAVRASLDVRERLLGDYGVGRFAWFLEGPVAYAEPIPARGALGLWSWRRPDGD